MSRQERNQVLLDTDGAHAWSTAAMGNSKSLVKVQVADIGTQESRRGVADLGIHVGTVHIDLSSVMMDYVRNLLHGSFISTSCGREGNH